MDDNALITRFADLTPNRKNAAPKFRAKLLQVSSGESSSRNYSSMFRRPNIYWTLMQAHVLCVEVLVWY